MGATIRLDHPFCTLPRVGVDTNYEPLDRTLVPPGLAVRMPGQGQGQGPKALRYWCRCIDFMDNLLSGK